MAKARIKLYADNPCHTKPCTCAKGDAVLVMQPKLNKLTPSYNPKPHHITHKKGSMITASRADYAVTRNSSHFKRIPNQTADNDYTHEAEYAEQVQYELPPDHHAPRVPLYPVPPDHHAPRVPPDPVPPDHHAPRVPPDPVPHSREHICHRCLNDYAM